MAGSAGPLKVPAGPGGRTERTLRPDVPELFLDGRLIDTASGLEAVAHAAEPVSASADAGGQPVHDAVACRPAGPVAIRADDRDRLGTEIVAATAGRYAAAPWRCWRWSIPPAAASRRSGPRARTGEPGAGRFAGRCSRSTGIPGSRMRCTMPRRWPIRGLGGGASCSPAGRRITGGPSPEHFACAATAGCLWTPAVIAAPWSPGRCGGRGRLHRVAIRGLRSTPA